MTSLNAMRSSVETALASRQLLEYQKISKLAQLLLRCRVVKSDCEDSLEQEISSNVP